MPALHKKGDKVTIYQMSHSKGLIVEGRATIRQVISVNSEYYLVEFDNEPGETYERFVDREGQEKPAEQYVKEFNARLGLSAA